MNPLERLLTQQTHDYERGGHSRHPEFPGRPTRLPSVAGRALRSKAVWAVAAVLLLVVVGAAVLAVTLCLPLVSGLLASSRDVGTLLAELPRLLSIVLVDAPKALLDVFGPLLKLKATLEGAG